MSDRSAPGERLSRRLMARVAKEGLQRRVLSDGGEVYSGPLASRALRAIGARAMTMDSSMFVSEDFDPSSPEDQAVYAHERVHMRGSGGDDTHVHRDAEEIAARAVESMVFHRASQGEDFAEIMRDVESGGSSSAGSAPAANREAQQGNEAQSAEAAYQAMLAQGLSHDQIVRKLAKHVMETIRTMEDMTALRSSEVETF